MKRGQIIFFQRRYEWIEILQGKKFKTSNNTNSKNKRKGYIH